jgi:hypothetical protein
MSSGALSAQVDDNWMELQRTIDASQLDGHVRLCFYFSDDGADGSSEAVASFDAGGGWREAWAVRTNPGPDLTCRTVCVDLSDLDPAVNRNPALAIKLRMQAGTGTLALYRVELGGSTYCDGEAIGAVSVSDPTGTGPAYAVSLQDSTNTTLSADVQCTWDTSASGVVSGWETVRFLP